tara:strand:+ start:250 stop:831 length:582 start_codon:yes stop_codon:yes gene_type:complete
MDELHTAQLNNIHQVPSFLEGNEPTILDILEFVKDTLLPGDIITQLNRRHELRSTQSIGMKSIKDNILEIEVSWSFRDGYFYVYGQKKTSNETRLTNEILKDAIEFDYNQLKKCPPTHPQDILLLERELRIFNSLLAVIKIYYNYKTEVHYAPGGVGYLEAKSHFEEMVNKMDSDNSIVAEEKAPICSFCLFN